MWLLREAQKVIQQKYALRIPAAYNPYSAVGLQHDSLTDDADSGTSSVQGKARGHRNQSAVAHPAGAVAALFLLSVLSTSPQATVFSGSGHAFAKIRTLSFVDFCKTAITVQRAYEAPARPLPTPAMKRA